MNSDAYKYIAQRVVLGFLMGMAISVIVYISVFVISREYISIGQLLGGIILNCVFVSITFSIICGEEK